MSLLELWNKYFGTEEENPSDFDVMTIPLPGTYEAAIEKAEIYHAKSNPWVGVRLKLRLVPGDPEDQQRCDLIIGKRQYVDLLARLEIKRTNDVTMLEGHVVPVMIQEAFAEFAPHAVRATLLEATCQAKKPQSKKPSRRKSSKTPSRRTGSA